MEKVHQAPDLRSANRMLQYSIIGNICKYQFGTAMELGFVKHFTLKYHFTYTDKEVLSNSVSFKSFHCINLG
jgi:hypothetical protein